LREGEVPATLTFRFSAAEAAALNVPANGQGGFQSLIRQLQTAYNPATRTIDMTDAMTGKVVRYLSYKPGGFEGRLARAFIRNIESYMAQ
jgi:hypothetical protein